MPFCFERQINFYPSKQLPNISQRFHEIEANYHRTVQPTMKIAGLFYLLLSELSGYCHTNRQILPKFKIIEKGIHALEKESITDLSVDELAKMCNVSPVYFRRLFKEYSHTSPSDYKLNSQIELAKQYLLYSDKSISDISDSLGFSSHSYFSRMFKKKTGMTPAQFIKNEMGLPQ